LVIHLKWKSDISIYKNFDEIKKEFNWCRFDLHIIPSPKVISFFGNNYLSIVVDKIIRFILRKDNNKSIIISLN